MGTWNTDASHSSPSLRNIPGQLLCYILGGSREKDKSNKDLSGKKLEINLGCHHVYPWCISTPPQWKNQEG